MEELVKNALVFIPNYFADLLRLVTGPQRFVAEKASPDNTTLRDSAIFLAISILLAWILEFSVAGHEKSDALTTFLALAGAMVFTFALAAAYGAALCLAWRTVRGDADVKAMFQANFYYAGVLQLIAACTFMATMGALLATDSALYNELMKSISAGAFPFFIHEHTEQLEQPGKLLTVKLVAFIGLSALLLWLIAGWGAYRELNHRSKAQSALAALLFLVVCIPVTAFMFLIASGGAAMHAASQ
jgi:hypothetical protein